MEMTLIYTSNGTGAVFRVYLNMPLRFAWYSNTWSGAERKMGIMKAHDSCQTSFLIKIVHQKKLKICKSFDILTSVVITIHELFLYVYWRNNYVVKVSRISSTYDTLRKSQISTYLFCITIDIL